MAVTEQQFIEQYSQLSADKQQKMYDAGNAQVKSWIDAYNASQTQTNNYVPTQNTDYTTFNQGSQGNQGTQGYYNSGAYNDVGGVNVGDWNYGIDTADRQSEIINNLNEYYRQDPSRFSDWDTFAKNFNYAYSGRSEKERETMRNWYSQNVGAVPEGTPSYGNIYGQYNDTSNTDYLFNMLMQGQQLQGTGAAVTAAQNRYRDYQSLSAMTPDQIASAIVSNSLNPVGQDMIDLKNYSPELYAQVQSILQNQTQIDDINAAGKGIYEGLTKSEYNSNYTKYNFTDEYAKNASVIKQYNENLYKKIEGLGGDTAAYVAIVASMLQNPLIQANKDEIENIEGEIRKIQDNIYTISDTAREKLGSEAPEDLVSAYISHQTKQLQTQLRTAQNSLLVSQGKLDNQLSEVETLIDALNNGIELEGGIGGTGGSSDYQFVSATKYQPAGYFNKKTGEFIPLSGSTSGGSGTGGTGTGGTGGGTSGGGNTPKYDYQDDSAARLKQISDNIDSIHKTNPDVFKNRTVFNDYFHFYERSQAQKDVLNSAWMKYGKMFGPDSIDTGTSSGSQESTGDISDDFVKTVKNDLLNGRIISLSASDMKKQYPQYWKLGRNDSASASLASKIGYQSTLDEIEKLSTGLSDSLTDNLYKGYWSNPKSITKSANQIKTMGDGNTKTERQRMTVYLNGLNISQSKREKILKEAGISDKYITKIIAGE